jgi:hypothetical protein
MKIEELTVGIKDIPTTNPLTNKTIRRGYKAEIAFKASKNGYIDYHLDNIAYNKQGDHNKGNYFYQVKANRSELHLLNGMKKATDFEGILSEYIANSRANRYVYIIEVNNKTYAIIMNTSEFVSFVNKFWKYEEYHNRITINISDNTIFKWAKASC